MSCGYASTTAGIISSLLSLMRGGKTIGLSLWAATSTVLHRAKLARGMMVTFATNTSFILMEELNRGNSSIFSFLSHYPSIRSFSPSLFLDSKQYRWKKGEGLSDVLLFPDILNGSHLSKLSVLWLSSVQVRKHLFRS